MKKAARPKVSVTVEQLDEPLDVDRLVSRYVEIALELDAKRAARGQGAEDRGSMAAIPVPAARSR